MRIVKYDDETEDEYQAFVGWYLSSPRRAPKDPDLAARNDWTMRAMMLDGQHAPAAIEDRRPQDEEAEAALKRLLFLEAGKFLGRSEAAPGIPTLTPTELLRLATIVLGKGVVTERETELPTTEEEPDLSNLSDEELAILSRIAKK